MAEIRPFKGIHYNTSLINDPGAVICPPYDIIGPAEREDLYRQNPYNFIRLEWTKESPHDSPTHNKYTRAAGDLKAWLKQGVLTIDSTPAIYRYDQSFSHEGKSCTRRGMTVVVRLEEWSKGAVRPHENTFSVPKSDRLNLLRALRANTSPVLGMFEDAGGRVKAALAKQENAKPLLDFKVGGEGHRLWAVTNSQDVSQIRESLLAQPIYIADGHHRYESALNYRNERLTSSPGQVDAEFNFVMMTIVPSDDPGLVILPTHRLIKGLSAETIGGLPSRLGEFFEVRHEPLDEPQFLRLTDTVWSREQEGEPELIVVGLAKGRVHVLKPHPATAQLMPESHSEVYGRLNVSVLEHVILDRLLGVTRENEPTMVSYTHDRLDALKRVLSGEYQIGFILSPIKAGAIKAIADASDRMARKSTYFYPKLPSGLLMHRLD